MFRQRYLHIPETEPSRKAIVLWTWFEYETEMFDKNYPGNVPSERDPDSYIPVGYEARKICDEYSKFRHNQMMGIASVYGIAFDEMMSAKRQVQRTCAKVSDVIKLLYYFKEEGDTAFIDEYFNRLEKEPPIALDEKKLKEMMEW